MKSKRSGKSTSEVEVTQISIGGIWLLIDDKEFFLPFEKFPRFRNATVGSIHNVQLVDNGDLHWPDLKIDLSVESIGKPEHVPQFAKAE
ncbi:MAG TPA: DUF2442 domain-containing protein [Pyrinomonadaceae bacterium]|jgi:hypothetical protein